MSVTINLLQKFRPRYIVTTMTAILGVLPMLYYLGDCSQRAIAYEFSIPEGAMRSTPSEKLELGLFALFYTKYFIFAISLLICGLLFLPIIVSTMLKTEQKLRRTMAAISPLWNGIRSRVTIRRRNQHTDPWYQSPFFFSAIHPLWAVLILCTLGLFFYFMNEINTQGYRSGEQISKQMRAAAKRCYNDISFRTDISCVKIITKSGSAIQGLNVGGGSTNYYLADEEGTTPIPISDVAKITRVHGKMVRPVRNVPKLTEAEILQMILDPLNSPLNPSYLDTAR